VLCVLFACVSVCFLKKIFITTDFVGSTSPNIVQCSANIVLNSLPQVNGAIVTWPTPQTSDTVNLISSTPLLSVWPYTNFSSGSLFPVGNTAVAYRFNYTNGRSERCVFSVRVIGK
jgi:hypothetical protein